MLRVRHCRGGESRTIDDDRPAAFASIGGDERIPPKRSAHHAGKLFDQPRRAVIIVEHKNAIGRECRLCGIERILGEEETFQAQVRNA